MSHTAHIDALAFGREAGDVFGAEAVAHAPDFLHAEVAFHFFDHGFDDGVDLAWAVAFAFRAGLLQPGHDVEVGRAVEGDGVAFEEVGHYDEVAVGGELVGDAGSGLLEDGGAN